MVVCVLRQSLMIMEELILGSFSSCLFCCNSTSCCSSRDTAAHEVYRNNQFMLAGVFTALLGPWVFCHPPPPYPPPPKRRSCMCTQMCDRLIHFLIAAGKVKEAAENARAFLLFHPEDPIMVENMKFYLELLKSEGSDILARKVSHIYHYDAVTTKREVKLCTPFMLNSLLHSQFEVSSNF